MEDKKRKALGDLFNTGYAIAEGSESHFTREQAIDFTYKQLINIEREMFKALPALALCKVREAYRILVKNVPDNLQYEETLDYVKGLIVKKTEESTYPTREG